jgi:hypothetical protein
MFKPTATMRAYVGTPAGPELRIVPEPWAAAEALVRVDKAATETVHPFWVYRSGDPVGENRAILARLTAHGLLTVAGGD